MTKLVNCQGIMFEEELVPFLSAHEIVLYGQSAPCIVQITVPYERRGDLDRSLVKPYEAECFRGKDVRLYFFGGTYGGAIIGEHADFETLYEFAELARLSAEEIGSTVWRHLTWLSEDYETALAYPAGPRREERIRLAHESFRGYDTGFVAEDL